MFCKNCGTEIKGDSIFCTFCGKQVVDDPNIESKSAEGTIPSLPVSKPKNKIIIVIVCIVVLVIAAISISMMPSKEYRNAKDAVDDLAYYYSQSQEAIALGEYDIARDWMDQFASASGVYLENFLECSEAEQLKLSDYFDKTYPQ